MAKNTNTRIAVDEIKRTITISQTVNKAASKYGTKAYDDLQAVKATHPGFRLIVTTAKKKNTESYKGLTYKYMENYIEKHDDENKSIMTEYRIMRGFEGELPEPYTYTEIREWFLEKFPVIAKFCERKAA